MSGKTRKLGWIGFFLFVAIIPLAMIFFMQKGAEAYRSIRDEMKSDTLLLPPIKLVNHRGDTLIKEDFEGRLVVAAYIDATAERTSQQALFEEMKRVNQEFWREKEDRSKMLFLLHTNTSRLDSIPLLEQLATEWGLKHFNFHIVTGTQRLLDQLQTEFYQIEEAKVGQSIAFMDVFVDKWIWRNLYDVQNKEEINVMMKHLAFMMPSDREERLDALRDSSRQR